MQTKPLFRKLTGGQKVDNPPELSTYVKAGDNPPFGNANGQDKEMKSCEKELSLTLKVIIPDSIDREALGTFILWAGFGWYGRTLYGSDPDAIPRYRIGETVDVGDLIGWFFQFAFACCGQQLGGRQMGNVQFSPEDPVFVLHHTNVDKWFALWQDLHYPNGIPETELETAQFSGGMDVPMAFDFNGVTASRSGQYFQLDGDYPTPRQVLLLDDDNINVVYEEDDLAQILVQTTSADETPYDPNARSPQVWFTLPSQTTISTSATEISTTVSTTTTTPQPPSTTTKFPATTTTTSEFVTFLSLSDSRVLFI